MSPAGMPGTAPPVIKNAGSGPLAWLVSTSGVPLEPAAAVANGFTLKRSLFDMDGTPVDPGQIGRNQLLVVVLEDIELVLD